MMIQKKNFARGLAVATLTWSSSSVLGQPAGVLPERLTEAQQRMMLSVSARHQLMSFSRIYALRARLIVPKDAPIWELWVNDWTHSRRVPTSNAPALSRVITCDATASDSRKFVFTFNGKVAEEYAGGTAPHALHAVACALPLTTPAAIEPNCFHATSAPGLVRACLAALPTPTQAPSVFAAAHQWSPDTAKSEVMVALSPDAAPLFPGAAAATPSVAAVPND